MNKSQTSICHRIEVETSPEALFDALTDPAGLAAWWTPMVKTDGAVGSVATFRFGDGDVGPDMRIDEAARGERVRWTCVEGPWKSMSFEFDIASHERGAVLVFRNHGWPDSGDFYMHCNAKWGYFLAVSLKSYLETGTGAPHPADPSI